MKLIYDVGDKPAPRQTLAFACQQVLAIMAATIAVPAAVGNGLSASAALFGAGMGTLVYQLFTKFKSPVFLGSSFAFIPAMAAAFAGAATIALGYTGLILGAIAAGLVYVILAIVVKTSGTGWVNKLMPPVVIGPTVACIGLQLAGSVSSGIKTGDVITADGYMACSPNLALVCALVTLFVVVICSTYGKKMIRLIPFIIGILAGYAAALIMTLIGNAAGIDALKIIDLTPFKNLVADGLSINTFISIPNFTFIKGIQGLRDLNGGYLVSVLVAYAPVAFVVFAEHIADHKNLSSIIERDLLKDPGLDHTLMGDGVGSIVGTIFGGCPNTTYGESIGTVAITKNASVISITVAAFLCILASFFSPIVAFLDSIPTCVMQGVCLTLYGFIAVSGLKMLQPVDLGNNVNLFTVSAILIPGIGGFSVVFGKLTITNIVGALILGSLVRLVLSKKNSNDDSPQQVIK